MAALTANLDEIIVDNISHDSSAIASTTTATTQYLDKISIDSSKSFDDIVRLERLSGYRTWKVQMENYFKSQDLWGVVDGSEPQPPICGYFSNQKHRAWFIKDRKARQAIDMKLDYFLKMAYDLWMCNSAKEAWDKLSAAEASARRKLVLDDNTGNYDCWKIDMKDHLRSLDLWDVVVVDGSESSDKSLPDKCTYVAKCSNNWESQDRKALRIINMACGPVLSYWIEDAPTAKCAWDRLSRAHNLHNVKYNATAASTINLNEVLTGGVTDYDSWKDLDEIILVDLSNFDSWRIYMEKYLRSQDLWNVVHGKKDCPTANMKAYEVIKMACGPQLVYEFVSRDSSAKRAWKDLRNAYTMHRGTNPLTPTNYEIWKVHLKKILRKNGLWSRVKLDTYYFDDNDDKKAYEFIANSCSQEMLPHIIYTTNPKEAWDQLKQAEAASVEEKERYRKMVVAAETAIANIDKLKRAYDEHLTQSNYTHFKVYLKQLLVSKYLWDIVDGNEVATVHNFPIWKNKNKAALELIRSSCGTEMQPHAKETNFAQEAWYKLARAAGASDEEKDPYTRYLPLDDPFQKDEVIRGFAREFLVSFPEAISCRMSDDGLTLLHSSIIKGKLVLAEYLIDMLSPKALEIKTDNGQLAISLAVKYNNMEMVKLMVDKNRKLLLLQNEYGHIPFVTSAICGDQEMMRYLYSETPMEKIVYNQILGDKYGAILVTAALRVDLYDVALDLLKLLPGLATVEDNNGMTVFHVLAAKPSAFLSGHRYGYFQKHLYWSAGVCSNGPFAKALKAICMYVATPSIALSVTVTQLHFPPTSTKSK